MAVWGEASSKVKRAIGFRERFTVAELVDATELGYEQVEQVVQRLKQRGYVRELDRHELKPGEQLSEKRVGRPRKRYTLTDDGAGRREFYAEVDAIASAERLARASRRRPRTPHFIRALQAIDAMERGHREAAPAALDEAAGLLEDGRDIEGLVSEGAEVVQVHYDCAEARLEALRGNYSAAEELLAGAEDALRAAGQDAEAQTAVDLRLAFQASRSFAQIRDLVRGQADPSMALGNLRCLVRDFPSRSPILLPLRYAIETFAAALLSTMAEMQISTWANTSALQQNTEAIKRLTELMESPRGDPEVGTALVPSERMQGTQLEPGRPTEPLAGRSDILITRREEHIQIPAEVFRQIAREQR